MLTCNNVLVIKPLMKQKRLNLSEIRNLGVSAAEFMRRSKLSFRTVQRMEVGDPGVREDTWAKAHMAIESIKAEFASATRGPRAKAV